MSSLLMVLGVPIGYPFASRVQAECSHGLGVYGLAVEPTDCPLWGLS